MAAIFTVGEFGPGIPLQCNTVFDPTAYASHALTIFRPRGLPAIGPVVPTTVATTYVRYAFTTGQVAADGWWSWYLASTHADGTVRVDSGTFEVAPIPTARPA